MKYAENRIRIVATHGLATLAHLGYVELRRLS